MSDQLTHETLGELAEWFDRNAWTTADGPSSELRAHAAVWKVMERRLEAAEMYIMALLKHHDSLLWGEYKTMDAHNAEVGKLGQLRDNWRALAEQGKP